MPPAILTGLTAEARLARPWGHPVAAAGGTEPAAVAAVAALPPDTSAIVSFGLAGGLHPALRPGDLLVPARVTDGTATWSADPALCAALGGVTPHTLLGAGALLATPGDKARAHALGHDAVDLESAAAAREAARRGIPFAALRAICDDAARPLPRAAVVALDARGRIAGLRVAWAALTHPAELPALLALARDAARARAALVARVAATRIGDPAP